MSAQPVFWWLVTLAGSEPSMSIYVAHLQKEWMLHHLRILGSREEGVAQANLSKRTWNSFFPLGRRELSLGCKPDPQGAFPAAKLRGGPFLITQRQRGSKAGRHLGHRSHYSCEVGRGIWIYLCSLLLFWIIIDNYTVLVNLLLCFRAKESLRKRKGHEAENIMASWWQCLHRGPAALGYDS